MEVEGEYKGGRGIQRWKGNTDMKGQYRRGRGIKRWQGNKEVEVG